MICDVDNRRRTSLTSKYIAPQYSISVYLELHTVINRNFTNFSVPRRSSHAITAALLLAQLTIEIHGGREFKMFRSLPRATLAGLAALAVTGTSSGASDIALAGVAAGRLYIVGTTERPHTAVLLDGRFGTESDEHGKFQYELVYHPATCIVAVMIDGKSHDAVVSNCGQQVMPGTWLEPHAAVDGPTLLKRLMTAKAETATASPCTVGTADEPWHKFVVAPAIPAPPVFTAVTWAHLVTDGERAQSKERAISETVAAN